MVEQHYVWSNNFVIIGYQEKYLTQKSHIFLLTRFISCGDRNIKDTCILKDFNGQWDQMNFCTILWL